jgi:uncharacterized protein (TIGR02466 family)
MPIEAWFPLAIYYEDLPEATEHQAALLETVLQLEQASGERRAHPEMAWTGDLHGVQNIHQDARFAWVLEQLHQQAQLYLLNIGIDLSQIDLYVQRGWPIVTRPGQQVGPHCHNSAHLSAVYYIAVPEKPDLDPGSLVFFDDARVNEVSPGLGSAETAIVEADNYFNQLQIAYEPVAGRMLIFPAKQRHAVTANETDELRVSLSFDLILTATPGTAAGNYEFLTPPPQQWQKLGTQLT